MNRDEITYDFNDKAWLAFHQGDINSDDDLYHFWMDYLAGLLTDEMVSFNEMNEILKDNKMTQEEKDFSFPNRPENVVDGITVSKAVKFTDEATRAVDDIIAYVEDNVDNTLEFDNFGEDLDNDDFELFKALVLNKLGQELIKRNA